MVVDHHQVPEEDASHPRLINAWNYGYDGGEEACSSTMAYAFAKALDERGNNDLSALALVGALGDRQDKGPDRSLGGLNKGPSRTRSRRGSSPSPRTFSSTGGRRGRSTRRSP